jgi:hypothetical protein
MEKSNTQKESTYAKRQRRRAEKIIAATGCYSVAFRNEVQDALDGLPHKLPTLFREAEVIDSRRETAGREVQMQIRKNGFPLGHQDSRTFQRSPKKFIDRVANEVESVMIQLEADRLSNEMAERAEIISDILYEIGNEAGVSATHPTIIKGYTLALYKTLPTLSQRNYRWVQKAFEHIQDLLNGCSDERFQHIQAFWSIDYEASQEARKKEWPDPEEGQSDFEPVAETRSVEIEELRKKLNMLERLPENEAIALQLESEIYRLEHESTIEEWPDVIGETGGAA